MLAEILYYRGANFQRRCWFSGWIVYFIVNFVLILLRLVFSMWRYIVWSGICLKWFHLIHI